MTNKRKESEEATTDLKNKDYHRRRLTIETHRASF
jgi:hypothetical protein